MSTKCVVVMVHNYLVAFTHTTIRLHPRNALWSILPRTSNVPSARNVAISSVAIKEQE